MKKKSNFFNWLKKHAKKGVLAVVLAVMLLSPCFAFLGHSKSYKADALAVTSDFVEFLPWGGFDIYCNANDSFGDGIERNNFINEYPTYGTDDSTGNYSIYFNSPHIGYNVTRSYSNSSPAFCNYTYQVYMGTRNSFNGFNQSITWLGLEKTYWLIELNSFLTAVNNSYLNILCTSSLNFLPFMESCYYSITGNIFDSNGVLHLIHFNSYLGNTVSLNRILASDCIAGTNYSSLRFSDIDFLVSIDGVDYDITDESILRDKFLFASTSSYDFLYFQDFSIRIVTPSSGFPFVDANSTNFYFRYYDYVDTYLSDSIVEARDYLVYRLWYNYKNNLIYDFTRPILSFVEGFFNMEIFPNFRISYILMLGVGALIFGFVLKFFLGG